jgi:hypothetical protein
MEEAVAEEAAEAAGCPAAGGEAVEDGWVHEQPHDVDGLGTVEAGSQRCSLTEAVDDPAGGHGALGAQLRGELD